ncbi:uncharacterized protein CLUP02_13809 [Colletotrichum lupini]|uniref:Uncharacterized protein n=1 Tax=Colletotrichum lupini TaxID=145971 RepID=A0A9Q8T509_9PEZI|nr:uncharacterized protein CLUP02_13809 [Colletotrichum lupini]UQC88286.1 hypothetical protein CLUP02_13809 [Colletotrichum lupini]
MGLMTLVHVVFLCIALHQLLKIIAIWLITGSWHNLWRIIPRVADDEESNMSDHESSLNWGDEFSFLIFDYSLLSDEEALVQLFLACVMIRHQSIRNGDEEQDVDPSHWVYFPWRVMEAIRPRSGMYWASLSFRPGSTHALGAEIQSEDGFSINVNSESVHANSMPIPGVDQHIEQGKWLTQPPHDIALPSPRDDSMLAYLRAEFDKGSAVTGKPFNIRYELGMFHRDLYQQLTMYRYRRLRSIGPITRQVVAARANSLWASNPSLRRFEEQHETVPWGVPVPFLTFQFLNFLPAPIDPGPGLERSWVSQFQIVCSPVARIAYVRIKPGRAYSVNGMTVEEAEWMIGGMRLLHVEMLRIWGLCRRQPMFWSGEDLAAFARDVFDGAAVKGRVHLDAISSAREHWRFIREMEGV